MSSLPKTQQEEKEIPYQNGHWARGCKAGDWYPKHGKTRKKTVFLMCILPMKNLLLF